MTLPIAEQPSPARMQSERATRYYKVQVRAWTTIDPGQFNLKQIAEAVDAGLGVLTALEVVKVAEELNGVDDTEVREVFESIRAVERIVKNMQSLPLPVRQRLQSALTADARTSAAA
jgi:hypothetical protein